MMKEAVINSDTVVTIKDVPLPTYGPNDVLVKVFAFGTNPKDWKMPLWTNREYNDGDDVAGIVEAVGDNVFEFRKGDRVAGFHVIEGEGGAFAEYAVVPEHTMFHLPRGVSFEEAATVPLTALTAALGVFRDLKLPSPWDKPADEVTKTPFIVYGASSAVGAYAIKLASLANIHPIIAVGSSNSAFIKEYLDDSKGDMLVDYKAFTTSEALIEGLKEKVAKASGGKGAFHLFDSISAPGTFDEVLSRVIAGPPRASDGMKPRLCVVLPGLNYDKVDPSVEIVRTGVGSLHGDDRGCRQFGAVWCRMLGRGLAEGWLKGHPYKVVEGGLAGLEGALKGIRDGSVRGKKMVGRIADTPGLWDWDWGVFGWLRGDGR